MTVLPQVRPEREPRAGGRPGLIPVWMRYPLAVYLASRLLFFLIAVIDGAVRHNHMIQELSNWDGYWYLQTAHYWYPHTFGTGFGEYSTLGFLPLYPGLMWLLSQVTGISDFGSGLIISMVLGLSATLLVCRLVYEWWGEQPMRRAVVFWSLWPGTIVFSMVYSEGVVITLIAGSMLLISRRRWVSAGLLAGAATAAAPIALAMIPACAVAAWLELRRVGWRTATRQERDSVLRAGMMVVLSAWGIIAFAFFLWRWTGTPLASYEVQKGAWQERSSLFAIPDRLGLLLHEIFVSSAGVAGPGIDLNNIVAVVGALFLLFGLWRLWKWRDTVPPVALVYTLFGSLLVLTSGKTPPNPRMLICLFPVLVTIGAEATGRKRTILLVITVILTLVMSWLTYVGSWMLP